MRLIQVSHRQQIGWGSLALAANSSLLLSLPLPKDGWMKRIEGHWEEVQKREWWARPLGDTLAPHSSPHFFFCSVHLHVFQSREQESLRPAWEAKEGSIWHIALEIGKFWTIPCCQECGCTSKRLSLTLPACFDGRPFYLFQCCCHIRHCLRTHNHQKILLARPSFGPLVLWPVVAPSCQRAWQEVSRTDSWPWLLAKILLLI